MKFTQTDFGNKKEILKFPDHYVAVAVTMDDAGVVANSDGKKIIPAGTIIGGNGSSALANPGTKVNVQNDADAEGVLFNDVDVTYGPHAGAMIIHGFINVAKLPTAPDPAAVTALKGRITFLK
ncbi:hypothetical protein SRRS_07140 [Sporomusa rhizae]|uniref:hypothetical protein n=1 Tax=Sporomusa rhizae TaxID=357999 RepID=UPI00352AEEFB